MQQLETRLEAVARDIRPDIIHAHSPVLNALPAIKVARKLGIPVVYEIRAFWEDAAVDHGSTTEGSLRYRATRALETCAIRRSITSSPSAKACAPTSWRAASREKVTVIPNAVDVASFQLASPPDPQLQKTRPHRQNGHRLHRLLLRLRRPRPAARRPALVAANPDMRVLLVGGGPQEANLRQQAEASACRTRHLHRPRAPQVRYYDLIDVLAYPRHRCA
jgi:glycosyltransferase involved in cell wall biosynthesis